MSRPQRRTRRIAAATAAISAIAVVTSCAATDRGGERPAARAAASAATVATGSARPKTARPDPAMYQAPHIDACRVMTSAVIGKPNNHLPPVPCSRRHTALTIFVGTLSIKAIRPRGISRVMSRVVARDCRRAFGKLVGGTAAAGARSMLQPSWFYPTPAQRRHGARWFRCDINSGYEPLFALPARLQNILRNGVPDELQRCVRDKGKDDFFLPCTHSHDARLIGFIRFGKRRAVYPGSRTVRSMMVARCEAMVQHYEATPNAQVSFRYSFLQAGLASRRS